MTGASRPSAILFACNLNRVRSPVAAALLRLRLGAGVMVDSCGLEPGEEIDPFAAAVMAEVGLDLTGHRPKGFDEVGDAAFDLVVSLSEEAHRRAVELARRRPVEVEFWPIADPTAQEGSREQRLDAYRAMQSDIARRLAARFPSSGEDHGGSVTGG